MWYALGFQKDFRCQRAGGCCRPGDWSIAIPMEAGRQLADAVSSGQMAIPGVSSPGDVLRPVRVMGQPAYLFVPGEDGYCKFLEWTEEGSSCRIHASLGVEALPPICRSYPREGMPRPNGGLMGLSASCPTVVDMLFDEDAGPFELTPAPPELAGNIGMPGNLRTPEPMLAPDQRMPDGFHKEWTQTVVHGLGLDLPPETAMARLACLAEAERTRALGTEATDPRVTAVAEAGADPERIRAALSGDSPGMKTALGHVLALMGMSAPNKRGTEVRQQAAGRYGQSAKGDGAKRLETDISKHLAPVWEDFSLPLRRYLAAVMMRGHGVPAAHGIRSIVFIAMCHLAMVRVMAAAECAANGKVLDRETLGGAIHDTNALICHGIINEAAVSEYAERVEHMAFRKLLETVVN